jgi:hypothetical protein
MASGIGKRKRTHDGVAFFGRMDLMSLAVGVMGAGTGVEVYGHVGLTMRIMEEVVVAGAVVAACLRWRAWSLRRAAA